MKNKQSKGLSLSANPKHPIVDRFKALTGVFIDFLKNLSDGESARSHCSMVINGHFSRVIRRLFFNVINSDEKVIHREI